MFYLNMFSYKKMTTLLNITRRLLHAESLSNRSLVKVSGEGIHEFLQGIITNDIYHLMNVPSIYTMFLNVQGRVLFDGIIYKNDDQSCLIDCDSQIVKLLINHLKLYKVRRKIELEPLNFRVWAIFDNCTDLEKLKFADIENLYIDSKHRTALYLDDKEQNLPERTIVSRDPRLKYLGDRIILPVNASLVDYASVTQVEGGFQRHRFRLGVGEGVDDFERGKCLPLEANVDYLHGVSFQKGCYIGQELTARTYHTGVIRKRFMPLIYEENVNIKKNDSITNEKGKNVGKVINACKGYGIGLMRIAEALDAQSLKVNQNNVQTFKPGWWPLEASKKKSSLSDLK